MSDGGDRTIHLYHTHTHETGDFTFKHNGRYDRAVLVQMNHFLRDWRNDQQTVMDPQLFDTLWAIQQQVGGGRINIVSCFRSPETNHMLHLRSRGVAEHSQHMLGKAMDIFIVGVPLEKLRETAMKMQVGGVGFYPTSGSPFVHVDTGNVRMWPRMTRSQLASVFPNGNTLYVPADGTPLPGFDTAQEKYGSKDKETQMAMLDAKMGGGGGPRLTQAALRGSASVSNAAGEKPNVASWLKKVFKDEDDSDDSDDAGPRSSPDDGAVATAPAAPAVPSRQAAPAPTDLIASPSQPGAVLALAPLPRVRPALASPASGDLIGTIDGTQGTATATMAYAPLPKGRPGMASQMAVASAAPVIGTSASAGTAVDAIADLTARMDVDTPVVASPVVLAASGKAAGAVSALVGGADGARPLPAASQLGRGTSPNAPASVAGVQLAYADATPTSDYDTTYGGRYANTPRAAPRPSKPVAVVVTPAPAAPAAAAKSQQFASLQAPVPPVSRIVTPIGHASLRVDQALADSVQQDDESMRRLMSQLTTRTKAFAKMGKPDPARGEVLFTTPATVADARNTNGGAALRTDRFAPAPVEAAATTASVEPSLLQRLFSSF